MSKKDDKPEGYYDDIEYPQEKKNDICALFSEYKVIEHTSAEPDYDYLEDNAIKLEIVNPYGKNNLFIELSGRFTLYFSGWHAHYSPYEFDYNEMKKDAVSIINDEAGALCIYAGGEWLGSTLQTETVTPFTNPSTLIEEMHFSEEHITMIRVKGTIIRIDYWRPNDCYEFEIKKESEEQSIYSFPRRYGVRFVVKNGIGVGSGDVRQYDSETAFISYVYIEPTEDVDKLSRVLMGILEEDARKSNSKKIFTNIDDSEYDLYHSLGYEEVPKIDDERVRQLTPAIIVFSKTMMKYL